MSILAAIAPVVNPALEAAPAIDPRDGRPAWTDEFRWELGPDPEDGPDPEETGPTSWTEFELTPEQDAWRLGFALVMDGEDPEAPAGMPLGCMVEFCGGALVARQELAVAAAWREADEANRADPEFLAREERHMALCADLDWDSMFPDYDPHHPAERVEAIGCVEARRS